LRALAIDSIIFASIYAALLCIERSVSYGWSPWILAGIVAASWIVCSFVRTAIFGRATERDAAVATDDRLHLKERVSSAVYARDELAESQKEDRSGWGQLVYSDGVRYLEGADVKQHFPLRLPKFVWFTALPVAVAISVWIWLPNLDLLGYEADRAVAEAMKRDIEKAKDDLIAALQKLDAKPEEEKNPEIQKILDAVRKQLEQQAAAKPKPGKTGEAAAQQAKKQALTQLGKQLQKVNKQLSQNKKFETARKTLEKMQQQSLRGQKVTRKLSQALKNRNLRQAQRELDKIQKQIEKLQKQTQNGKKALTKEQRKQLQDLAEELYRLGSRMGPKRGLNSGMSMASKGLKGMNFDQAMKGLQLSKRDLEDLAKQQSQMQTLQQAKQALQKAQQQLAKVNKHKCPNCNKPRTAKPGSKPGGT